MYGKGISREGGRIDVGVEAGIIRKAGAWDTYEGDQLGQGKETPAVPHRNPTWPTRSRRRSSEAGVGPTVVTGACGAAGRADRRRCLLSEPVTRGAMTTGRAPGSTSGSTDAWTGGVETGFAPGCANPAPPDPGGRARRRPERWPGRSCSTSWPGGPAPQGAERQAGRQAGARRDRDPAARPVRGGRAGRRRRVRPQLGQPAPLGRRWRQGAGPRALAQELRRKGIDDETAREALDELDPADEEESARVLVRRKLRALSRFDDTTATCRLVGMLARKGYSSGLAFAVVRDELAQAGRECPGDG